jgi:hypothetical protein
MTYNTMTIKQAVDDIDQSKLYLPALQRKFVWGKHQIELLFDSLMRNYPIGSFLFWRLKKQRAHEYVFYEFLKEYDQRNPYNRRKTGAFTQSEILGVLDGQQRLSSLYIGLMGTHTEKAPYKRSSNANAYEPMALYLNLLSLPYIVNNEGKIESQEERNFEFRFLPPIEASRNDARTIRTTDNDTLITERTEPVLWIKVGDVLKWDEEPDVNHFVEELESNSTTPTQRGAIQDKKRLILKGLNTLHKRLWSEKTLNYFEIQKDDLEDILKIFVRVNSGGTVLGKTALLFSTIVATWDDGREQIEKLLKEINATGEQFDFTSDYLMRCCLMLTDAPVVYKVHSFKADNVQRIQREWPNIAKAIQTTVRLIADFGFNGSLLTSQTATTIIAYHIYKGGDLNLTSKEGIRKYLVHALVTRIFGSSQDQLLTALRNSLREEVIVEGVKHYRLRQLHFSFPDLLNAQLPSGRSLTVTKNTIAQFLERKKGPDAFALLVLLYPHLRFHDQVFHQDHIHPSSRFNPDVFEELGLTPEERTSWMERRDAVPNLQLMKGKENVEKNATPLVTWMARMTDAERNAFLIDNYFPENVGLDFSQFNEFYNRRKQLLLEALCNTMAIDAKEEPPRSHHFDTLDEISDEEEHASDEA